MFSRSELEDKLKDACFFSAVYAIILHHSSESRENVFDYHNYKFLCEELD